MSLTVAEFMRSKVHPGQRHIVNAVRDLMSNTAPGAKETIAFGTLAWRRNEIIAVINPTKKYAALVFLRGAEFSNRYGLLEGSGKIAKYIKLEYTRVNSSALRYYIRQAVKFDYIE
jgi:hypothetical protein